MADFPGLPELAPSKNPKYSLLRGTFAMLDLNFAYLNKRYYCKSWLTVFYLCYF